MLRSREFTVICLVALSLCSLDLAAEGIDNQYEKPAGSESIWQKIISRIGIFEQNIPKNYALVVGISEYDEFKDLPTQSDATRVRDYLIKDAGFDLVHTLTEEKVTQQRLDQLMRDEFPNMLEEKDRFLFYWSGHGIDRTNQGTKKRSGYLPLSYSIANKYSTMIKMSDIRDWDSEIPARHTLYLLDSCLSGLAGAASKSQESRSTLTEMLSQPAHYLMTAGNGDEEVLALDNEGSLFTTAILNGLNGFADTSTNDYDKDGLVTLNELHEYVNRYVARKVQELDWNKTISPQVRDLRGSDGSFFFITPDAVNSRSSINSLSSNNSSTKGESEIDSFDFVSAASDTRTVKLSICDQNDPEESSRLKKEAYANFQGKYHLQGNPNQELGWGLYLQAISLCNTSALIDISKELLKRKECYLALEYAEMASDNGHAVAPRLVNQIKRRPAHACNN